MRNQAESRQNSAPGVIPRASWRVIEVHTLPDYRLAVKFMDGTTGEVDLSRLVMSDSAGFLRSATRSSAICPGLCGIRGGRVAR